MDSRQAIRMAIEQAQVLCQNYVGDLDDADLLVRVVPGINHIAWQLGHLISGEHSMIETLCPGSMPPLPPGFIDKHTSATAGLDDPAAFETKSRYLALLEEQRAGTWRALAQQSDADLDKPGPEAFRTFAPTVGALFIMQATHWLMHGGQWAVVRRKLGRPPLF